MKSILFRKVFILSVALIMTSVINAEVRLSKIIGSNMVLQRNQDINVWGWADAREKITVHFNGVTKSVRADRDGKWLITLPVMKAGGPYDMKIRGKNIIELENILIGDIWICSGQSNMVWPVERSLRAEDEASRAGYTGIRLFTVPNNIQYAPAVDIPGGEWQECNAGTVLPFSAVGYFFGRDIHRELKVPIGLISTNWGGTNVETWTSGEAIGTVAEFTEAVAGLKDFVPEVTFAEKKAEIKLLLDKYKAEEPGLVDGEAHWAAFDLDMSGWGHMELPGNWEDRGFGGLDGIIWFRLDFHLEEDMAMREGMILKLGPVDDSDITWVNGHQVGSIEQAWNKVRAYPVPKAYLREGRNVIAIRVEDTGGDGGIFGSPEQMQIVSGDDTIPLAGTWRYRISPTNLKVRIGEIAGPNSNPTLLFNGMIHPLLNLPVKGAIWYQGESNAGRAYQYRRLFPMMIEDWRNQWNQPDMPFFFVQLANYMTPPSEPGESTWAELREAQSMALALPNTGMAVAIDIGETDDIHPKNKQDVGKRLALSALKVAYGKDIVHSGPVFKEITIDGPNAIISFVHYGSGLICKDRYGYLKGFAIAGSDRVFHWAKAHISGNRVWVYSDKVKQPVAVRYGWADNPDDVNLYNKENLPASPFRTDDWPGITGGK